MRQTFVTDLTVISIPVGCDPSSDCNMFSCVMTLKRELNENGGKKLEETGHEIYYYKRKV